MVYERSNTYFAPDSGTTSGSRQTLFTGEACIRACQDLKKRWRGTTWQTLKGQEFYGEYLGKTDPLGAGAQPRQPHRLRLCHPGLHAGQGRTDLRWWRPTMWARP